MYPETSKHADRVTSERANKETQHDFHVFIDISLGQLKKKNRNVYDQIIFKCAAVETGKKTGASLEERESWQVRIWQLLERTGGLTDMVLTAFWGHAWLHAVWHIVWLCKTVRQIMSNLTTIVIVTWDRCRSYLYPDQSLHLVSLTLLIWLCNVCYITQYMYVM